MHHSLPLRSVDGRRLRVNVSEAVRFHLTVATGACPTYASLPPSVKGVVVEEEEATEVEDTAVAKVRVVVRILPRMLRCTSI